MLLIRCPQCKAVFRANENQLKSRRGRVRCGKCAATFNGLENVVEAPPAPPPAPAPAPVPAPAPAPAPVAPPPVAPAPQPEPVAETVAEPLAPAPVPASAPAAVPEAVAAEVPAPAPQPQSPPVAPAPRAEPPAPQPEAEPEPVAPAEPTPAAVPEPPPAPPPAAAPKEASETAPEPVPAPAPVPAKSKPTAKPKTKPQAPQPEPQAPPPVVVQDRQEPSFGPVPPVPARASVAVPEIRIEPGEHGLPAEPVAAPPPRKPLFAPGQLRRAAGMLLLAASAAVVLYLLTAYWARIVPLAMQLGRSLMRALANPAVQALLVALVMTVLVIMSTRRPSKKPVAPADGSPVDTLYQMPEEQDHFWRWTLVTLLLIGGLVAQTVYFFRTEIAILAPDARPALERVCAALGCTVPLPRRSDLVSIETSDLHPVQGRSDQLQLIATVKNRAFYRQDWPHLEVTLTDTRDKPVVRRVFAPAEYLPEDYKSAPGFNGNQELQLDLTLQIEGTVAAGYRLYVFYP